MSTPRPIQEYTSDNETEDPNAYRQGGYHPVKIGDRYNNYVIQKKLGWGYFSTVWLASNENLPNDHPHKLVALKIQKSSPHYFDAALDEIDMLNCISTKSQQQQHGGYGSSYVVQLLDSFQFIGPNGQHACLVFETMGKNILKLIRHYGTKAIPPYIVKITSRQLLLGLHFLHTECNIIHTDLKPENLLLLPTIPFTMKSLLDPTYIPISPYELSCNNNDPVKASIRRFTLKISDLGTGCWTDRHFTEDISTRQYRAPESIVGLPYSTPVDIWATACVIFEMLTTDFLFDPKTDPEGVHSRSEDHLAQINELLGSFPQRFITDGRFSRIFFNHNGSFLHISDLEHWPLVSCLTDKYGMSENEAKILTETLLLPMLRIEPNERATAQDALKSPWLDLSPHDIASMYLDYHIGQHIPPHIALAAIEYEIERTQEVTAFVKMTRFSQSRLDRYLQKYCPYHIWLRDHHNVWLHDALPVFQQQINAYKETGILNDTIYSVNDGTPCYYYTIDNYKTYFYDHDKLYTQEISDAMMTSSGANNNTSGLGRSTTTAAVSTTDTTTTPATDVQQESTTPAAVSPVTTTTTAKPVGDAPVIIHEQIDDDDDNTITTTDTNIQTSNKMTDDAPEVTQDQQLVSDDIRSNPFPSPNQHDKDNNNTTTTEANQPFRHPAPSTSCCVSSSISQTSNNISNDGTTPSIVDNKSTTTTTTTTIEDSKQNDDDIESKRQSYQQSSSLSSNNTLTPSANSSSSSLPSSLPSSSTTTTTAPSTGHLSSLPSPTVAEFPVQQQHQPQSQQPIIDSTKQTSSVAQQAQRFSSPNIPSSTVTAAAANTAPSTILSSSLSSSSNTTTAGISSPSTGYATLTKQPGSLVQQRASLFSSPSVSSSSSTLTSPSSSSSISSISGPSNPSSTSRRLTATYSTLPKGVGSPMSPTVGGSGTNNTLSSPSSLPTIHDDVAPSSITTTQRSIPVDKQSLGPNVVSRLAALYESGAIYNQNQTSK